jgi:hypothetical protein
MPAADTNDETLALQALVWTLAEPSRATRLLDVTGLSPDALRASAGERATLVAALSFLESHEPDLLACAEGIGVPPTALVAARARMEGA